MSPQVEALLKEIAPAIESLVTARVNAAVDKKIQTRELVVSIWRGQWLAGVAYGTGSMVEHGGRVYRATDATTTTPALDARGWQVVADVAH